MKKDMSAFFPEETSIPVQHRLKARVDQKEYLINGELRRWDGQAEEVRSPVCVRTPGGPEQKVIGSYPKLTEKEALEALAAAQRAYDNGRGAWPTMTVEERIACVVEFTGRMVKTRDEVVRLLMWEIGKSLKDAEKEFDRTVQYIGDTVNALKDLDRACAKFDIKEGIIGQIRRSPMGVVLCMGPYNYPLNETFTTLIPALIMGNSVIFKPPKLGVLLHSPLLEAFQKSFPGGVVNTLYGDGETVISPVMKSGLVNVLAFVGSSRVADILKKLHPKPHRLRCVLGLEAKNAGIVLPDADISLAVKECLTGSLSYNGQRCTALKILFVHEDILKEFLVAFTAGLEKLRVGMPWDENVGITPLPEDYKPGYLSELVANALEHGAQVINPGGGTREKTLYYPAVVCPVTPRMDLYHVEQFGPVVPVVPFREIDKALEFVEHSNYGQQVSIFGGDAPTIARLIDPLVNQVCRVNVNTQCQRGPDTFPFTGRKDSAEATLSVSDALRVFSIRTLVATRDNDANKELISSILRERMSNFLSTDFIF